MPAMPNQIMYGGQVHDVPPMADGNLLLGDNAMNTTGVPFGQPVMHGDGMMMPPVGAPPMSP